MAHALETHKTRSSEDVEAVIEGTEGPLVDASLPTPRLAGQGEGHPEVVDVATSEATSDQSTLDEQG